MVDQPPTFEGFDRKIRYMRLVTHPASSAEHRSFARDRLVAAASEASDPQHGGDLVRNVRRGLEEIKILHGDAVASTPRLT